MTLHRRSPVKHPGRGHLRRLNSQWLPCCRLVTCLLVAGFTAVNQADEIPFPDDKPEPPTHIERKTGEPAFSWRVNLFDPQHGEDKERLWSQTKSMAAYAVGVAGFLSLMPKSFTNWGPSATLEQVPSRWYHNVSRRPVWDNDDWAVNYIGHTYFGGVYYQVARKSGFSQWDSFVYAGLVSTFLWEYGLEAIAERPSIQDLIVTPIGGWLYGEWAHRREKTILARDGKVMGSRTLGAVSLFLLDPVERLGNGINAMFGREVVKTGSAALAITPAGGLSSDDRYIGLQFYITL